MRLNNKEQLVDLELSTHAYLGWEWRRDRVPFWNIFGSIINEAVRIGIIINDGIAIILIILIIYGIRGGGIWKRIPFQVPVKPMHCSSKLFFIQFPISIYFG